MQLRICGSRPDGSWTPAHTFAGPVDAEIARFRSAYPDAVHVRVDVALPYTHEAQSVYDRYMLQAN